MNTKKIIIENHQNEVVRCLTWQGEHAKIAFNHRLGRLEFIDDSQFDLLNTSSYKVLHDIFAETTGDLNVEGLGWVRISDQIQNTIVNIPQKKESEKAWWASIVGVVASVFVIIVALQFLPEPPPEEKPEEKQEVVKVFKKVSRVKIANRSIKRPKVKKRKSVRRMGALAALGSLKKSKQNGGLDLNSVTASRGPGLGGTQGSGGVQKSLYAKGVVAAPLGEGSNLQGAGGYGTKGKGGGKAGYGQVSLIGSSGIQDIALGDGARVEGGLDRDLIAAVIQKNMGQIRFCYEQGLQTDPSLSGRVSMDFVIGPNGRVSTANVGSSSLQSGMVEKCMLLRLRSWNFPKPEGGVNVKVSYPFVLKRLGHG